MKIKLCLSLLSIICLNRQVMGQDTKSPSVISAAGTISKSKEMSLEWTVGESFVESLKNESAWYTQGYHQPLLFVKQVSKPAQSDYDITVFPNPTLDKLNVTVRPNFNDALTLKMIDITGRTVLIEKAPGGSSVDIQLKLNHLPEGMYLLSIIRQQGLWVKTFKIMKH